MQYSHEKRRSQQDFSPAQCVMSTAILDLMHISCMTQFPQR